MSELLKIKLTIADRVYPLTVAPDQEEDLRKSAKKIDAMIKQLEQKLRRSRQARRLGHVCFAICNPAGTKK